MSRVEWCGMDTAPSRMCRDPKKNDSVLSHRAVAAPNKRRVAWSSSTYLLSCPRAGQGRKGSAAESSRKECARGGSRRLGDGGDDIDLFFARGRDVVSLCLMQVQDSLAAHTALFEVVDGRRSRLKAVK